MQGQMSAIGAQVDEALASLLADDSTDSDHDSDAEEKAAEKAAKKVAAEKAAAAAKPVKKKKRVGRKKFTKAQLKKKRSRGGAPRGVGTRGVGTRGKKPKIVATDSEDDVRPARKPSKEVRQGIELHRLNINSLMAKSDRRLLASERNIDALSDVGVRVNAPSDYVLGRTIARNLNREHLLELHRDLLKWIVCKDAKALHSFNVNWRKTAERDAKASRAKDLENRKDLVQKNFLVNQKVSMLAQVDEWIREEPTRTWDTLHIMSGKSKVFREILPQPILVTLPNPSVPKATGGARKKSAKKSVSNPTVVPKPKGVPTASVSKSSASATDGESVDEWFCEMNAREKAKAIAAEIAAEKALEPAAGDADAGAPTEVKQPEAELPEYVCATGPKSGEVGYCGSERHAIYLRGKNGADHFHHEDSYVTGTCAQC